MTSQKAVTSKARKESWFSKFSLGSLRTYLRAVRSEFKKIHWTSRADLIRSTRLVLVATLLFGLLVYLTDLTVRGGLGGLKAVFRMISQ